MKSIASLASAVSILQVPPTQFIDDGRIHRFSSNGKRYDRAGWYVSYGDVGVVGCWRSGEKITFCDREPLNDTERRQLNKKVRETQQRDFEETQKKQIAARQQAARIWDESDTVTHHPYLQKKHVRAHGIRRYGQCLIIPLVDEGGTLWSLQSIRPDGYKKFMPDGKTKGMFHCIQGHASQVGVVEGYSTAASIFEMTGNTMYVALNCGNLENVAVIARALHPLAKLTIWGDSDQWTPGNPGKTKAKWAATISRAELKIPDFTGFDTSTKPTDWNDYFNLKKPAR